MSDFDPRHASETDWRARLDASEYHVLREAGTERPGTGKYLHEKRPASTVAAPAGQSYSVPIPSLILTAVGPHFSDPRTPRSPTIKTLPMAWKEPRCVALTVKATWVMFLRTHLTCLRDNVIALTRSA